VTVVQQIGSASEPLFSLGDPVEVYWLIRDATAVLDTAG
jgi:hypothetical protein